MSTKWLSLTYEEKTDCCFSVKRKPWICFWGEEVCHKSKKCNLKRVFENVKRFCQNLRIDLEKDWMLVF